MFVKDLMSKPVQTVFENSTVGEAREKMKNNDLRRLPVVDFENKLVGIVTEGDLAKNLPRCKAMNTFEYNLLLRTPVSKVMHPMPVTISPDEIIEKAALVMRMHKINSLPVVNEQKIPVGIISKNDIFDAFISSLGLMHGGTRVTITYKRKWGFLSELIAFADNRNIWIDNIVIFNHEIVLKLKGRYPEFIEDLQKAGYIISDVSYIEPMEPAETAGTAEPTETM